MLLDFSSSLGTPPSGRRVGRVQVRSKGAEAAAAVRAGEGPGGADMESQRWLPLEANPEVSVARVLA